MISRDFDFGDIILNFSYQETMYRTFAMTFAAPPSEEFIKKVASISRKYNNLELWEYSSQYSKIWQNFLYFSSRLDGIPISGIGELLEHLTPVYNEYVANMKIPMNEYDYHVRAEIDNQTLLENLTESYTEINIVYDKTLPEDHISSEMVFMAHMRGVSRYHLENDDAERFLETIVYQQLFYKRHISVWAQFFSYLVSILEENISFYRNIGEMMGIFLKEDTAFLQKMVENKGGLIK
jgi:TorA maturation chaperone TorD